MTIAEETQRKIDDVVLTIVNDGTRHAEYSKYLELLLKYSSPSVAYALAEAAKRGQWDGDNKGLASTKDWQTFYSARSCMRIDRLLGDAGLTSTTVNTRKVAGGVLEHWLSSHAPQTPHHLDRAIAEQNAYYNKPTTKDTTMTIKIETKTFLNGSDISGFTEAALFIQLSEAEREIEKLKAIKTQSKKIAARIAELEQGCIDLATAIDAR